MRNKDIRVTVRFENELLDRLNFLCDALAMTRSQLIRKMVREYRHEA